jgi:hypothetical protein
VDIESLEDRDLDQLLELMEKHKDVKGSVAVKQKIVTYRKLLVDVKGVKISRLEPLVLAVKKLLEPTPHKWLFIENEDGYLVPWYVYNVDYNPPDERNGAPAHTDVSLAATKRGTKITKELTFHINDLGDTAYELLRKKGFFVETPEIVEEYAKENLRYQAICGLTGEQFLAVGDGFDKNEYWSSSTVSMERDQMPTKVVMDDESDEGEGREREGREHITSKFWTEDKKRRDDDGGEADENSVIDLPLQPYVKVFDLMKHCFVIIHVANLTEYRYDAELINKLVLPEERKELVSMLVEGADVALDDIVKGKTGGIIVICTGPPGTGKTLTAEVFSEQVKRPLYCVQCSQLGTNEQELEKELVTVLGRAQRWKAILLIDEADVYVHTRGNDIQQNAIVGVFLRVLEYYRGILFMTSNRETIIDDAIMSRATAWIRYDIPDRHRAVSIWKVLSTQYKVQLKDVDIEKLVDNARFKAISGRSIKNLLKLAKLRAARKKVPISIESIEYVSQFLDLEMASKSRRPDCQRAPGNGGHALGYDGNWLSQTKIDAGAVADHSPAFRGRD